MDTREGGCVCGGVRFAVTGPPMRVTVCHCRFCQRATGSAFMIEPIWPRSAVRLVSGTPATYDHRSEGSGKVVYVHFCPRCGTKLYLTFERFPDSCGVYAGTFDDPGWFDAAGVPTKHIFVAEARPGSVIPAGIPAFAAHAMTNDGTPLAPVIHAADHVVPQRG
jgi:hypothetical protein